VLGDNIFYGHGLRDAAARRRAQTHGATVFGYWVRDPERYGVAEFDARGPRGRLEEKPAKPKSNYAVTGLYFYDGRASDFAARSSPRRAANWRSPTSTALSRRRRACSVDELGRGHAWLDTGTHESLLEAGNFIETIEARQGLKVCCPEEIAFRMGWIDAAQLQPRWPGRWPRTATASTCCRCSNTGNRDEGASKPICPGAW
jgi:glucose-1-phosphate thymidylyltransferase